jgi:tetratricopeptide (TPR) repeat protein
MRKLVRFGIAVGLSLCFAELASAQRGAPWVGESFDGAPCDGKPAGFGPFDYLNRGGLQQQLRLVEGAHFTSSVEQLRAGNRGSLLGDLDYTLRAWPNHHRALNAMIRYQTGSDNNMRVEMGRDNVPPVECYLFRAINFSPDDGTTYMLLGVLAHRKDLNERALDAYRKATALSPRNIQAKYNLALLLLDLGDHPEAEALAAEVYEAGYPLQGLRKKLDRYKAGHE